MNIQRLRYFVAIAHAGSVSLASRQLHVAQPAMSNRIRQLEADLGVTLFERHPNGVALTRAGTIFLPYALETVTAYDSGRHALRNFGSMARLAIGCTQTLGLLLAPRVIAEYHRRGLTAEIVTKQGSSAALIIDLRAKQLDALLCYEVQDDADLAITPLFEHDIHLVGKPGLTCAAGDGSIAFSDISQLPLVLDPRSNVSRQRISEAEHLVAEGLNIFAEVELTNAKAELMLNHGCYALVPRPLFGDQISAGLFQAYPLRDVALTLEAKLASRRDDAELIRPFITVVRQVVAQIMQSPGTDLRPHKGEKPRR